MIEETLIIIKPDAFKRGVEYEILDRIQKKGFDIPALYKGVATPEMVSKHYEEPIERMKEDFPGFEDLLIDYITSGPIMPAIVRGEDAVEAMITLTGRNTEPANCAPGTIRGDYSNDSHAASNPERRATYNIIHRSASVDEAEREIDLWFVEFYPDALRLNTI